jgi:hypothetical protein
MGVVTPRWNDIKTERDEAQYYVSMMVVGMQEMPEGGLGHAQEDMPAAGRRVGGRGEERHTAAFRPPSPQRFHDQKCICVCVCGCVCVRAGDHRSQEHGWRVQPEGNGYGGSEDRSGGAVGDAHVTPGEGSCRARTKGMHIALGGSRGGSLSLCVCVSVSVSVSVCVCVVVVGDHPCPCIHQPLPGVRFPIMVAVASGLPPTEPVVVKDDRE